MPPTKLTLSVDRELVRVAKQMARRRGTSLSAMFERFIRSMTRSESPDEPLGPLTSQALGMVRLPEGRDAADLVAEALAEKYRD